MNVNELRKEIENKKSRFGNPFKNFDINFRKLYDIYQLINNTKEPNPNAMFFNSFFIIHTVSILELFFKDILDTIFLLCKKSSFEKNIDKIYDKKFSLRELIDLENNNIHQLELVSLNLNMQNLNSINSTFSKLMEKDFLKSVKELKFRIVNTQKEYNFEEENISDIQKLFSFRHELIHNANYNFNIEGNDIEFLILNSWPFALVSSIVIFNFIELHIKDEFKNKDNY